MKIYIKLLIIVGVIDSIEAKEVVGVVLITSILFGFTLLHHPNIYL